MNQEEVEERILDLSVRFASFESGTLQALINMNNINKEMSKTFVMLNGSLTTVIEKLHNETESRLKNCETHKKDFITDAKEYTDNEIKNRMVVPGYVLGVLLTVLNVWAIFRK